MEIRKVIAAEPVDSAQEADILYVVGKSRVAESQQRTVVIAFVVEYHGFVSVRQTASVSFYGVYPRQSLFPCSQ
jgi:uncharacterized protein YabN with tetrapyrrole methylase and pyrophosphatase domain